MTPAQLRGPDSGTSVRRARIRRALLCLAVLAAVWAAAVGLSGGFVVELGSLRISSRSSRNPFLLALASLAGAAWACAPAGARLGVLWNDLRYLGTAALVPWHRAAPLASRHARAVALALVVTMAAGVVWFGLERGALVAGGGDSYGYVSQARLWATGTLRVEQPLLDAPPGGIPQAALAPLGYTLPPARDALVPFYAPGLPMTMALFERAAGPDAVFWVMPLLAGVAVWATFALGVSAAGTGAGVAAALMLATSPAFVFQLTHAPMSDIPAMAWWSLALVLAVRGTHTAALLSGLAASAAILTRPNMAPLALVPAGVLAWPAVVAWQARSGRAGGSPAGSHDDGTRPQDALRRALLFVLGTAPGVAAVAVLNAYWYGSPLLSGYGRLAGAFYRWEYFGANIVRYPAWLLETQTILVVAAVAAPFLLWRRRGTPGGDGRAPYSVVTAACAASVVLTYACYAFYIPYDVWWVLRFLLPAFPPLFVLTSAALLDVGSRLPGLRSVAGAVLVAVVVLHAIGFSRENAAYDSQGEWRYATTGRHIAARFPERAVFFAMLHSGSIRHYSGRLTIRYDLIEPRAIAAAVADLRRLGYVTYAAIDDAERDDFARRFEGTEAVNWLETPVARVDGVTIVETN